MTNRHRGEIYELIHIIQLATYKFFSLVVNSTKSHANKSRFVMIVTTAIIAKLAIMSTKFLYTNSVILMRNSAIINKMPFICFNLSCLFNIDEAQERNNHVGYEHHTIAFTQRIYLFTKTYQLRRCSLSSRTLDSTLARERNQYSVTAY